MTNSSILQQAANSILVPHTAKPPATEVVQALLQAEKSAKTNKLAYSFDQLIGNWRLCFITGTKKTRAKAGIMLGAGRYLPKFFQVELSYTPASEIESDDFAPGKIENCVTVGEVTLIVSGPAKFLSKKNILAFDFTRMTVKILGIKVFSGFIRNGEAKEQNFYAKNVREQAFFAYFLIDKNMMAARGRGGGLAIWGR